jgi:hypothetical protein
VRCGADCNLCTDFRKEKGISKFSFAPFKRQAANYENAAFKTQYFLSARPKAVPFFMPFSFSDAFGKERPAFQAVNFAQKKALQSYCNAIVPKKRQYYLVKNVLNALYAI